MEALIGKKLGMTQVFDEQGVQVPVTVIQAGPCVVMQRKTAKADGYDAVQLGFGDQKDHRVTKALLGHFKKAGKGSKRVLREVELGAGEEVNVGDEVTVAIFDGVSYVDVIGITKGRGFQGVVKRHGFTGGPGGHGSMMHRRSGSIGNRTWPARVFKNKRMAGHMGHVRVTVQNLKVQKLMPEDSVMLVRGAIPGPTGCIVVVRKAIKKAAKAAKKS
jgi:large subunit ribosomal protein L3